MNHAGSHFHDFDKSSVAPVVCAMQIFILESKQVFPPMTEPAKKPETEKATPTVAEETVRTATLPADTKAANNANRDFNKAGADPLAESWMKRMTRRTKTSAQMTWRFTKELFREHEFWVHTLAVKGGLSAIAVTGILGISYVVAMPFMVAAAGIAACGAVIGLSAYGMAAGAARGWHRLRKVYARATGKPMPQRPVRQGKTWLQRQCERPFMQKILHSKPVEAFKRSRAWRLTKKFTDGQQDNVLGSLAVGGAVLSLAVGVTALVTQLAVLPVVAVGGLVTFATVMAASYIVSGISGLYFGITGIRHMKKEKQAKAAARAAAAQNMTQPGLDADEDPAPAESPQKPLPEGVTDTFKNASEKPAAPAESPPDTQPLAVNDDHKSGRKNAQTAQKPKNTP